MINTSNQYVIGVWYTAIAYIIWGFLPLYWKLVDFVPSMEILAHRIIWSLVFVSLILLITSKWEVVTSESKMLFSSKKQFLVVLAGSLLISLNWLIYIWAVNSDFIIEASLGYYINPLLSVLLGIIVLKERLTFWQTVSFTLAAIGVAILTIKYGKVPWIALSLALSFALYGLIKKQSKFNSLIGLAFETLFVVPIALIYLIIIHHQGSGAFLSLSLDVSFLLMGAGIATALPLLLFAVGAKRIPLSMVGFLQYIAPTISLGLGVFIFKETFTVVHFISFSFIWTALTIYSLSKTKLFTAIDEKMKIFRNNTLEM